MRLSTFNKKIQKEVSQHLELVKGEGYFYFIYDDGKHYDSESVYMFSFGDWTADRWVELARGFYAKVQAEIA